MRRTLVGSSVNEQLQSADNALSRLHREMESMRGRPHHVSPFIISGLIDSNTLYAYIPINCTIDIIDVFVDSILMPAGEEKKPMAGLIADLSPIVGVGASINVKIGLGHSVATAKYKVIAPTRVTISFDRPVQAWVSIAAYPTHAKQSEVESEGVSVSDIQLG